MLQGKAIRLRPITEKDLETLWERHTDLQDRGEFFPLKVVSKPRLRRQYEESGFWTDDDGTLLIVDRDDTIIGHIEYFPTVNHLDEVEIAYHVYGAGNRGKGAATEAVVLMTRYLFERKNRNRIRLMIHADNKASRRVAEKAGYRLEGIARGAWYNRGKHHDMAVYAVLKDEFLSAYGSHDPR